MKVLVVGGGGREHALAWKIKSSQHVSWVGIAPGNGGTTHVGENVNIAADDLDGIVNYVQANGVNLTVIGPEAPLAAGLADRFTSEQHLVFGPSAAAARIESDKRFAKDFMQLAGIPTAAYRTFNDHRTAKAWIERRDAPMVVKASGLAAGKGVFVCMTRQEALDAVKKIMEDKAFGAAGSDIIVEDALKGKEISLQVMTDGVDYLVLPPAQDHKRLGEGDTGPNTGGMGAYAPAELMTDTLIESCAKSIIEPTLRTFREMGTPYKGLLYVGLMITDNGPQVLEFNCRFGDPETQAVLPLLGVDLVDLMLVTVTGKLGPMMQALKLKSTDWRMLSRDNYAATVILAAAGYPGSYKKGIPITNIPTDQNNMVVFHAGTKKDQSQNLVTSGGRVLAVTGLANTLKEALYLSYEASEQIEFDGRYFRKDIGHQAQ
ncbi:phosphoribosylamine--glycine ligase [bacterium]|nr:phosphoribosylamine--glycine ligase [bacterium]